MEFKDFSFSSLVRVFFFGEILKILRKYSILFDIKSSGIIYDLEAYWLAIWKCFYYSSALFFIRGENERRVRYTVGNFN